MVWHDSIYSWEPLDLFLIDLSDRPILTVNAALHRGQKAPHFVAFRRRLMVVRRHRLDRAQSVLLYHPPEAAADRAAEVRRGLRRPVFPVHVPLVVVDRAAIALSGTLLHGKGRDPREVRAAGLGPIGPVGELALT